MGEAKRKSECGYDMVMFTIGARDDLTPSTCEKAAAAWRTITAENPKAKFVLQVGGFDDDPRELWEFPEVCAYVQRWANLVGLDTLEDAGKWVGSCEGRLASPLTDDELQGNGFSVLAGLEVFGPEAQADALADLKPTPHN
jgi:hypothetical protein